MGSERGPREGVEDGRNIQFSNLDEASFCRSFIDTRDSRLLIVYGSEQAETVRQEMKSRGESSGAEPCTCGNRPLERARERGRIGWTRESKKGRGRSKKWKWKWKWKGTERKK